jgi:hypothetical protein
MNIAQIEDAGPPLTIRVFDCVMCEERAVTSSFVLPLEGEGTFRYGLCEGCLADFTSGDRASSDAFRERLLDRLLGIAEQVHENREERLRPPGGDPCWQALWLGV